jgi:L-asparaginase
MNNQKSKVLLIYTGGTIGMIQEPESLSLKPFDFKSLSDQIPELNKLDCEINCISFEKPIDSSNMQPQQWVQMATIIEENYFLYDGFVVLHGTDTMAYTASALSFMFEKLSKPIILTGSQLPIGVIRTDGKENLITAIEIAAAKQNNKAVVPEVAVYFEYKLYRGNRTHKHNAAHFNAFESANYPVLAQAGVHIEYYSNYILNTNDTDILLHKNIVPHVAILFLFPGIQLETVRAICQTENIKALILLTYGAGNAPMNDWLIAEIEKLIQKQIVVVNVTQCNSGSVEQGRYQTSKKLLEIGVVSGGDMTVEAALTKLMVLLGINTDYYWLKNTFVKNLRGELST